MKYIVFTFEDGRADNYTIAKNIMDNYGFKGTIFITTGFIDGTWKDNDVLMSPSRPLTIDEIKKLKNNGWEIGLHGDKHQSTIHDMSECSKKLINWKIKEEHFGVSIPNSDATNAEVLSLFKNNNVKYVRRGRKTDVTKIKNKLLYAIYTIFGFNYAYQKFNLPNIIKLDEVDKCYIPSVVVKSKDKPENIINFIDKSPDDSLIVLMFHSILSVEHPLINKDVWSWSEDKFSKFCFELNKLCSDKAIKVIPLIEIFRGN